MATKGILTLLLVCVAFICTTCTSNKHCESYAEDMGVFHKLS
jgi:hypothetical protein